MNAQTILVLLIGYALLAYGICRLNHIGVCRGKRQQREMFEQAEREAARQAWADRIMAKNLQ